MISWDGIASPGLAPSQGVLKPQSPGIRDPGRNIANWEMVELMKIRFQSSICQKLFESYIVLSIFGQYCIGICAFPARHPAIHINPEHINNIFFLSCCLFGLKFPFSFFNLHRPNKDLYSAVLQKLWEDTRRLWMKNSVQCLTSLYNCMQTFFITRPINTFI